MKTSSIHAKRYCSSWIALILWMNLIPAEGGVKSIERVRPRYGQQGTTVDVTIYGVSINDPREVIFFKPGIRATDLKVQEEPPRRRGFAHGAYFDMAVNCKFQIAPDCPPGQHTFRLLTANELTHIGTFHVSPFKTIDETPGKRETLESAMPVAPNVTINGKLNVELRDLYKVPVEKGQRLTVEVHSVTIADRHYGDSEYDFAVRILNQDGKEIATNDDNSLLIQDPVLSTQINYTGDAYVSVERSVAQFRETVYAVHIGTNPRPIVAFPAGAEAGSTQSFRLIGDALGEYEETLTVPTDDGDFTHFPNSPTPVRLRSSPFPNVIEDQQGNVTNVPTLPIALNGVIDNVTDIDSFRIQAKKDQPLHVRVFSAAIGSPLDPILRIRNAAGEVELESDDAKLPERDVFGTSYRGRGGRPEIIDPSVIWKPKSDGEYTIEISDTSRSGGDTGVYRIEVESPRTVVQTLLQSKSFDWAESTRFTGLAIPRGNRWSVNVTLPEGQWNRIPCAFDLIAHGLPKGVRMTAPRLQSGNSFWPVLFTADNTAKPGGSIITLAAKPVDDNIRIESRSQENVPFLNHSGGDALHYVKVDRYIMGVTDPAPFSIDIDVPKASLVRGGELAIPVQIKRLNGFTGPVEYWVRYIDRSISYQPPTTIPDGETDSVLRLQASASAKLGDQLLVVAARSMVDTIHRSLGAGDRRASTEIVTVNVAEPYVELKSQPISVRRGGQTTFRWTVTHKTPFEGAARVRLLGLPKGVHVVGDNPVLTPSTTSIAFPLRATGEALLGQVTGIGCEVVLSVSGQDVTQRTGRGTLRIDPAVVQR